jgi:Zn-dependent protease
MHELEGVLEWKVQKLTSGVLGHPECAALDRSAEAGVCVSFGGHERMFALARTASRCQDETTAEGKGMLDRGYGVMIGLISAWAICVVAGSALVHEFGHAWTARAVGWKVIGLRWHWYGVAVVADTNGKPDQLWKVALGGLSATAFLALGFLAATALPEPAPFLFGLGFMVNAGLLLTNLVPVRWLDGGQMLAGMRRVRSHDPRSGT